MRSKRRPPHSQPRATTRARSQPSALARPHRTITPRERQILELVWQGLMNRTISRRLRISVRTVEAHRSTIMRKMGVSNTAQLLRHAIRLSLIRAEESRHPSTRR